LRSLIKKKIDWVYAFLLSIICYGTYTALYFMLKSIVSDTNVVYVPIISGFSLCMAGLLLALISGIFAQVFGKEKETPKKQYKPYSRKKKKPHKRKK